MRKPTTVIPSGAVEGRYTLAYQECESRYPAFPLATLVPLVPITRCVVYAIVISGKA